MRIKGERKYKLIVRLFNWVFKVIQKYTVINKEILPQENGLIFIINHRDYYDIPIVFSILGTRPIHALIKAELQKEIAGKIISLMGAVFVDRENPQSRREAKEKLTSLVLENRNILIAPEGTRNKTDDLLLPFKGRGAVRIAQKTGRPIIPFAISKHKTKRKNKIVQICAPYFVKPDDDLNEANKILHKILYDALLKNEDILKNESRVVTK